MIEFQRIPVDYNGVYANGSSHSGRFTYNLVVGEDPQIEDLVRGVKLALSGHGNFYKTKISSYTAEAIYGKLKIMIDNGKFSLEQIK